MTGPRPPRRDDRAVTVRTDGAGDPLVLLLGGCGVPSDFWQPVVDRLPGAQVLRLDRAGMAGSPWPGALPTLAAEVADLTTLLVRYDRPAVVVAHSMAGPHAEALARRHPTLVAALVLVDPSVAWPPPRPSWAGRDRLWLGLARLTRRLLQHRAGRSVAAQAGWWGTAGQTRVRTAALRGTVAATYADPEAVAATVAEQAASARQLADLDALRAAHAWPGVPTVVLAASADGGAGWVADQRRLADLLGGCLVVVEDARHLMMLDCPDVVAAAVRAGTDDTTVTEKPR